MMVVHAKTVVAPDHCRTLRRSARSNPRSSLHHLLRPINRGLKPGTHHGRRRGEKSNMVRTGQLRRDRDGGKGGGYSEAPKGIRQDRRGIALHRFGGGVALCGPIRADLSSLFEALAEKNGTAQACLHQMACSGCQVQQSRDKAKPTLTWCHVADARKAGF